MTELTKGIFKLLKRLIGESSIALAIIYTIGTICNWLITGAAMELAAIDAIVEPIINGIWFYLLHKLAKRFIKNE
jgi:uncharacterized membrane protein